MSEDQPRDSREHGVWDVRLHRVEEKLDALIQRMDALIRLEERHNNLANDLARVTQQSEAQAEKIQKLETSVTQNSFWRGLGERGFWILVAGVVGVITYKLRG